jgi:hypothetical protein
VKLDRVGIHQHAVYANERVALRPSERESVLAVRLQRDRNSQDGPISSSGAAETRFQISEKGEQRVLDFPETAFGWR